jgi:hypothetical protein
MFGRRRRHIVEIDEPGTVHFDDEVPPAPAEGETRPPITAGS